MNGDSKIIYDAVASIQKDITALSGAVATNTAKVDERHESNLRALENMSGDVTIIRSQLQNLPCGETKAKIDANEKNIGRLWKFTVGGVLLIIAGAAVKIWLL